MYSYNEVLKALSEGETIQVQQSSKVGDYRDLTFNETLKYVIDETYEPRHFRIKPKKSPEEELWVKHRKDSSVPYSVVAEFVEELKKTIQGAQWIDVPAGWMDSSCPDKDLDENITIIIKFRNGKQEIIEVGRIDPACWVQEGLEYDIVAYKKACCHVNHIGTETIS